MYSVKNNLAIINGRSGKYDNTISNPDVRYGRNACDNYMSYVKDLGNVEKTTPWKFEYRYMPDGKFNRYALMGNAYEELGKRTRVKTDELNLKFDEQGLVSLSANALDINQDGYVDVSEYATSTLSQDILSSTDGSNIDPSKVNGVITNEGEDKALVLNKKEFEPEARKIFSKLYNEFDLGKAQEEFLSDKKNLQ